MDDKKYLEFTPAFRATAQVSVTPKEGFSLGEALESVYPLLGLVFDYLGYKDLERVSLVNSAWETEAEKEMKKRINVAGWLTIYTESELRNCVEASKNFGFQRVQYIITFYGYNYRVENHEILDPDVDCCDIYFTDLHSVYPKNYINPMTRVSLVDVCLIPIIPNVRVATVCNVPTDFTKDVFDKSPNERMKCVLVFSWNYQDCAFGGAFTLLNIEYRNANETDKQYMTTDHFCIGFIENTDGENNNFDAASFIIGDEVNSADEFEQTLIQFKRKITIREHSLAFRFCYSNKTTNARDAVIFSKIFPDTLQYGVYVVRLIGCNTRHFKEDSTALPQTNKRCSLVVEDRSGSVIVFLTWGRIITS